jgi:hypothetical protein
MVSNCDGSIFHRYAPCTIAIAIVHGCWFNFVLTLLPQSTMARALCPSYNISPFFHLSICSICSIETSKVPIPIVHALTPSNIAESFGFSHYPITLVPTTFTKDRLTVYPESPVIKCSIKFSFPVRMAIAVLGS